MAASSDPPTRRGPGAAALRLEAAGDAAAGGKAGGAVVRTPEGVVVLEVRAGEAGWLEVSSEQPRAPLHAASPVRRFDEL